MTAQKSEYAEKVKPTLKDVNWPQALAPKILSLRKRLGEMGSALVAFSGGSDSTFLAMAVMEAQGTRALAVTAASPAIPEREIEEAKELARTIGIRHRIIATDELELMQYACNEPDRCYHCKNRLFSLLKKIAAEEHCAFVLDGTNADDRHDYRPGARAGLEHGVKCPLMEAGFTKDDIRSASRLLELPTADKPAAACLASRIPYGTPITADSLHAVEQAENGLKDLGFRLVRVRAQGSAARIELDPSDIARAAGEEMRTRIHALLKNAGFKFIALDLQGYRRGSWNPEATN